MEASLRLTESLDWISLILLGFLLAVAITRQFTTLPLEDFLSAFTRMRFVKITSDGRMDNHKGYQAVGIAIYVICISLLFYKMAAIDRVVTYKDFLIILTVVSAFLLFRHYLSRLVGQIGNFEQLLIPIDHQRNIYRAILSTALAAAVIVVYYIFPENHNIFWAVCIASGLLLFYYHILVIYSHRRVLIPSGLYFILYLCTLEIAPYLLLYKYITV